MVHNHELLSHGYDTTELGVRVQILSSQALSNSESQ